MENSSAAPGSSGSTTSCSKALAIDLDGTLLIGEKLTVRNRDAVRKARDVGYQIIIATARWRQMAERIAAEIGLVDPVIIACSGAQVYDSKSQQDMFDTRLPEAFVQPFFDICNSNRCIASATVDSHSLLKLDQEPAKEFLTEELHWVANFPEADTSPRIATVQGSATIALVRELHQQAFQDKINIFDSVGPSGKIVITITSSNADKGIALDAACRQLKIDAANVTAFGDADNDLRMFSFAGRSVAMGQANDQVKKAADHVTSTNLEDGVAEFIERNLVTR